MRVSLSLLALSATPALANTGDAALSALDACLHAVGQSELVAVPDGFTPIPETDRLALAREALTIDSNGTTVTIMGAQPAPDIASQLGPFRVSAWGKKETFRCRIENDDPIPDTAATAVREEISDHFQALVSSGAYVDYPRGEIPGLTDDAILLNGLNPAGNCVVASLAAPDGTRSIGILIGEQDWPTCQVSRGLFE